MKTRKHENELVNDFIEKHKRYFFHFINGEITIPKFFTIIKEPEYKILFDYKIYIDEVFYSIYCENSSFLKKVVDRPGSLFREEKYHYECVFTQEEIKFIYNAFLKIKSDKNKKEKLKKQLLNKSSITQEEFDLLKKLLK